MQSPATTHSVQVTSPPALSSLLYVHVCFPRGRPSHKPGLTTARDQAPVVSRLPQSNTIYLLATSSRLIFPTTFLTRLTGAYIERIYKT